jgi:hypothetical protein
MKRYALFVTLVVLLIEAFTIIQNPLYSLKAEIIITTTTVITSPSTTVPPSIPRMDHYGFHVGSRDFTRGYVYCCRGCKLFISFSVVRVTLFGSESSDIIFRVVAPDGREVIPRMKIYGNTYYELVTEQEGDYVLEFDNTYSDSRKYIDLAIAVASPPQTVTMTSTVYRYEIIGVTFTTTTTQIVERIVERIVPTTIYIPTTTTLPITTTETVEKTVTSTITTISPVTVTSVITSTVTETQRVLDISTLAIVAIALLALGIVIGYFIKKVK